MKMTGAEWREFEETGWPEGYIWADESILGDRDIDEHPPADNEVFTVPADWRMIHQDGPVHSKDKHDDGMNVRAMIRDWRKARDTETVVVTIPKADAEDFRALMTERKWKVA